MKLYDITANLNLDNFTEEYNRIETELIDILNEYLVGAKVTGIILGSGIVTAISGANFEDAIATVKFESCTKPFLLNHIITNGRFVRFVDPNVIENYNKAYELHTSITADYIELKATKKKILEDEAKKLEEERQAELKYQRAKEKAIRDFNRLSSRKTSVEQVDDFYYTLGWLTAHIGTLSAAMPDYLESSFIRHFGSEVPHRVVDSKKRTISGYQTQWAMSFKASLVKVAEIPMSLTKYLNPKKDAISCTEFIWDLVETYGFQFGKKQNIELIEEHIPVEYLSSYQDGLLA